MSNVIQFPTSERLKQVIDERIDHVIQEEDRVEIQKEECVELAQYCFQLMDQAIRGNEFIDGFEDMDFTNPDKSEMRDMSAVVNMLAGTFYRYKGMEHPFQEDLDNANTKLDELMGEFDDAEFDAELEELGKELKELLTEKSDENDID